MHVDMLHYLNLKPCHKLGQNISNLTFFSGLTTERYFQIKDTLQAPTLRLIDRNQSPLLSFPSWLKHVHP